jgi:hypothetical protein
MTADNLTAGVHRAWFLARNVKGATPDLPVVARVRRRCRCHQPYRIDVTWSDGRRVRYLPTDRLDVVEVAA